MFSEKELDLLRQWFNSVQDVSPSYLEVDDYALADKIHYMLGRPPPKRHENRRPR